MNVYFGHSETSVVSFLVLSILQEKGDALGVRAEFLTGCILMLINEVYHV